MLATPVAFVVAVADDNAALALDPGAANVTVTPLNGLFPASRTVTCSGDTNAVLIAVDCGVPPVAVIEAAAPAVLVSAKVALNAPTLAVTA